MIAEALLYLRSFPATPAAFRRHLPEAVGLWARGRRQRRAWAPHLEHCRSLIETIALEMAPRRTVAILGSGPCFDLPLETLARSFSHVLLIDQAHLASLTPRLRPHANVERIWRDLAPPGERRPLAFLNDIDGLDWVISLNLLSQLARAAPEGDEIVAINAHLIGLAALPCRVTLITDTAYRVLARDDALIEEFDLMHGRKLPTPATHWSWEVAPIGEEGADRHRIHSVCAWPDWHAAIGTNGFIR
jgi:hypothetical protein